MIKEVILASNNKGKIQEFKDYLKQFDIDVISQKEAGCNIDVKENGTTYSENALIKAEAIYKLTGKPVIADDSGFLEVDFIDESGKVEFFSGECEGKIAYSMRGNNGMGYDPIFEYEGRTFAEMKEEEKNKVSHRGKAKLYIT